jgi:hypothetical protein
MTQAYDNSRATNAQLDAPTWTPHPAAIAALLLTSLALRIPGLLESIWYDEACRTFMVLRPQRLTEILLHDVHNPLYNALMYSWIRVFGDSELSIRAPSILAGYTMIYALWHWVRQKWGGHAAWFTAAWLLLSPVPVWYSTEAKNTMFTALAATLIVITHDRLFSAKPGALARPIACAIAASILGILTDFQVLLTLIPIWIASVILSWREPAPRRALRITIAATTALILPFLFFKAAHIDEMQRDYLRFFNLRDLLKLICLWFPTGNVLPSPPNWWPVPVAATGLILLPLLWHGLRSLSRSTSGRLVATAFLAAPAFYLAAGILLHWEGSLIRIYQERNLIVMLAWYPLVLALGLLSIHRRAIRTALASTILGAGLLATLLTITVLSDASTVMHANPDWRGAGRILAGAESTPLVFSRTPLLPLSYYNLRAVPVQLSRDRPPVPELESALAGATTPDFFLISDPLWDPIKEGERAAIDQRFPLISRTELRSLTIERRRTH